MLVRFTRNCPWNHCTFCSMYKGEKFELRTVAEICADIDAMAGLAKDLIATSQELGHGGQITRSAILTLVEKEPALNFHEGFGMLINWLAVGGTTAFIQDANSMIMKPKDLVAALTHLRSTFPTIGRVTTYARSRTLVQRSPEALASICRAGLDRLHLGMETGDDTLLKHIKKGVTSQGHIEGGQKAMAAGFQVSEYWMPGLGGKALSQVHALNTARVLNQINPHYIRSRPFRAIPGTPLYHQVGSGGVEMLTPREGLLEIQAMVQALEVTSRVCFDHAGNHWKDGQGNLVFTHAYEGYKFPEEKSSVLERIQAGLAAAS